MPRQQTVQGVFLDCHMRPPSASLSPHTRFLTVPFLRSQRFEKLTMRLKPRTEVSAHLARRPRTASFEALHPLDGRGLAHPEARRSRPPAHPSPNHRVDHPVAQVLRICTGHPRWPPPSQQVESEQCRFGNPNRFKLDTACSSMTNDSRNPTTTDAGIPVASDEHSLTVGPDGPILLQD